ncbi:26S proteasome non-ATPase regulatory subunit 12 [Verticillium dahliae VDG1]|nr:26S proteasome non-ATPase regulatory subunit 12 [Verticillium dahliae VDG1]
MSTMASSRASNTPQLRNDPVELDVSATVESSSPSPSKSQGPYALRPGDSLRGKFLHVPFHSKLEQENLIQDGRMVYDVPFLLVMPAGLDRTSDSAGHSCRPLPPSFRNTRTSFSSWNPVIPPNVFITYAMRVSVTYSVAGEAALMSTKTAEATKLLHCLPYIEPQPPIEIQCFPNEYILSAMQPVWNSIIGRKLGHMTITTVEPRPLIYHTESVSSTECEFRITIEGDRPELQRFQAMSLELHPVLQIQTYYSSARLVGPPPKSLVTGTGPTRVDNDVVNLDKHRASHLFWTSGIGRADSQQASELETMSSTSHAPPPYVDRRQASARSG